MSARLVVRNGRSPFQFVLMAVCVAAGLLGLTLPGPGPSNNIVRVFGLWTPWFYVLLFGSAVIVIIGMLLPRSTSGRFRLALEVERIGLWPCAGASIAYGVANLAISGQTALVAALLTAGIGVAAFVRIYIITVDLRRVAELLTLEAKRGDDQDRKERGEKR